MWKASARGVSRRAGYPCHGLKGARRQFFEDVRDLVNAAMDADKPEAADHDNEPAAEHGFRIRREREVAEQDDLEDQERDRQPVNDYLQHILDRGLLQRRVVRGLRPLDTDKGERHGVPLMRDLLEEGPPLFFDLVLVLIGSIAQIVL